MLVYQRVWYVNNYNIHGVYKPAYNWGGPHCDMYVYIYIAGYICQSLVGYIIYNTVSLNIHVMHLEWTCSINTHQYPKTWFPSYIWIFLANQKHGSLWTWTYRKHLDMHMFFVGYTGICDMQWNTVCWEMIGGKKWILWDITKILLWYTRWCHLS